VSDAVLAQAEADRLMALEKEPADRETRAFPGPGEKLVVPLVSVCRREEFVLSVGRGRIDIAKAAMQTRTHQTVILARIETNGRPHTNPDGGFVPCPHIHVYREGYGDKWAYPVPETDFPHLGDMWRTYVDFLAYCNVTRAPNIERGLF
jgi:hypothetical protein